MSSNPGLGDLVAGAFTGTARYELKSYLGSGSMGTVYRVLDRESGSQMALKLLDRGGAESLLRFRQEFRIVQQVDHPNVVAMGELEEQGERSFYTMELIEGIDFLEYVGTGEALDEPKLRRALAQLADALTTLHAADIVHRDIKPSNVLVTDEDRAVVVDFGLMLDSATDNRISSTDAIIGTAAYMAPEQMTSATTGAPADCYALGVILYQALTGLLPFRGNTIEVLMQKKNGVAAPPSSIATGIPEDLERLCIDLLATDPAKRPNAVEIAERLGLAPRAAQPTAVVENPAHQVFVGRQSELERIGDAIGARAPRILVVQGPSGVGKSTLVEQARRQIRASFDDAVVFDGRCYERESINFNGVDGVVESLAQWLREQEAPPSINAVDAELLTRAFPALQRVEYLTNDDPTLSSKRLPPRERRKQVFAALRSLMGKIARRAPTMITVDDVQWASADSLAVLEQIMADPDAPPVALLLIRRSLGEADPDPLNLWHEHYETIDLAPLEADESAKLATALMGDRGMASTAASIAREAHGHPLLIHYLASHYLEARDELSATNLDEALMARIDELSPLARIVLESVAVAAIPLPHLVIAEACELEIIPYNRATVELARARLVRSTGSRPTDTIVHYHDRIREALTRAMPKSDLRTRHRKLAMGLENTRYADAAPQLAVYHMVEAGQKRQAAFYAEAAAANAYASLSFGQAAELYETALVCGDHDDEKRTSLMLSKAEALVLEGRGSEAADLFLVAANALVSSPPIKRLEYRRRAAEQLLFSGHIDEGIAVLEAVLGEIGQHLPKTPRRAFLSLVGQRAILRIRWLFRGLRWRHQDLSEVAPLKRLELDIYVTVADGLTLVDNIRGAAYQSRALRVALGLGLSSHILRALSFEAALLSSLASPRASKLLKGVKKRATELGDTRALSSASIAGAAEAFYMSCNWKKTWKAADEAEHILRHEVQSGGWETNTARMFKCFALLHQGKLRRLGDRLRIYSRDAAMRGDRYAWTTLRARLIMPRLADDDTDLAQTELDEAIESWIPWQEAYQVQHFFALHSYCELALYRGDWARARQLIDEQYPPLAKSMLLRVWFARGEVAHLRGRIALTALVKSDAPHAHCRRVAKKSAAALKKNRLRAPRGWALLIQAGLAHRTGHEEKALNFLESAVRELEEGDSLLYANAARRVLGAASVGERASEARSRAMEWERANNVVNPARLAAMLVPGFDEYD